MNSPAALTTTPPMEEGSFQTGPAADPMDILGCWLESLSAEENLRLRVCLASGGMPAIEKGIGACMQQKRSQWAVLLAIHALESGLPEIQPFALKLVGECLASEMPTPVEYLVSLLIEQGVEHPVIEEARAKLEGIGDVPDFIRGGDIGVYDVRRAFETLGDAGPAEIRERINEALEKGEEHLAGAFIVAMGKTDIRDVDAGDLHRCVRTLLYGINQHLGVPVIISAYGLCRNEARTFASLLDRIDPEVKNNEFAWNVLYGLIASGNERDIPRVLPESIRSLEGLKELLAERNRIVAEDKRVNLEAFWERFSPTMGNLCAIDIRTARSIFRDIVLASGPFRLNRHLEYIGPVVGDPRYMLALRNLFSSLRRHPGHAVRLLELAAGYHGFGLHEQFISRIVGHEDLEQAVLSAGRRLLPDFAAIMGIESVSVGENVLEKWHLPFLGKLLHARHSIRPRRRSDEHSMEVLFNSIVHSALEGSFSSFITEPLGRYPMQNMIAEHNARVRRSLLRLGINLDVWLNPDSHVPPYSFNIPMEVSREESCSGHAALVSQLGGSLTNLKQAVSGSHALVIDGILRNKMGLAADESGLSLEEPEEIGKGACLQQIIGILLDERRSASLLKTLEFIKDRSPEDEQIVSAVDHFMMLREQLREANASPVQPRAANLTARVWRREPGIDLFQGNFTSCCVAIDSDQHPSAILEYLTDQGIQVIEIIDDETGTPIAQTWCFIAEDEKTGLPLLVMDNVEIAPDMLRVAANQDRIRDAIIDYAAAYAAAAGAAGVCLGDTRYNDINVNGIEGICTIENSLTKAGGYLWDVDGDGSKYYLESLFGEATSTHPKRQGQILLVRDSRSSRGAVQADPEVKFISPADVTGELIEEICDFEVTAYSDNGAPQLGREFIEPLLRDPEALNLLLLNSHGRVKGYLLAQPSSEATSEEPCLYIQDLAVHQPLRASPRHVTRLFQAFHNEASSRGIRRVLAHVRQGDGTSKFMLRKGAEVLETAENWMNSGSAYDLCALELSANSRRTAAKEGPLENPNI